MTSQKKVISRSRYAKYILPMRPIFIPDLAKALRADWAPGPGVFDLQNFHNNLKRF